MAIVSVGIGEFLRILEEGRALDKSGLQVGKACFLHRLKIDLYIRMRKDRAPIRGISCISGQLSGLGSNLSLL